MLTVFPYVVHRRYCLKPYKDFKVLKAVDILNTYYNLPFHSGDILNMRYMLWKD